MEYLDVNLMRFLSKKIVYIVGFQSEIFEAMFIVKVSAAERGFFYFFFAVSSKLLRNLSNALGERSGYRNSGSCCNSYVLKVKKLIKRVNSAPHGRDVLKQILNRRSFQVILLGGSRCLLICVLATYCCNGRCHKCRPVEMLAR
ncbi:uncharacterized protein LOC111367289 [Olea europaea var. sylvestris]|uniref:uncharacterized protein LOC111367289 n=1 Tax=Olea europaea var. sylvestris TaxID=158386 RepID=UPI000C1D387E|nr:uncharacterized protein LOC111367289 [Olea europaea var. sylvestris]